MNLEGKTFGFWKVFARDGKSVPVRYHCVCKCGTAKSVFYTSLVGGTSQSCGCLREKHRRKVITTHGRSYDHIYGIWNNLSQRCYNPKSPLYKHYGAKGVTVCEEWRNSFETFLRDMGERPKGMSLDRIDSTKEYSRENCRWANWKTQANNRTNNRRITWRGQSITTSQFAEILGKRASSVHRWLFNEHRSPEELFTKFTQRER